ncbi:MAG: hypothetical protein MUC88_00165 [Planctomycetes bacterium]|jgi:hypothetical protein|nr:hypothetical protein [Planctomycetota bacterium]
MIEALVLVGALSVYHPGDGHNHGELACGGRLTWQSEHIAIRRWRGRCGARVRVCVGGGRRCVWSTVRDSGPWGATDGRRWEVQIRLKRGWRRRAVVDLSWALWVKLGRPPFLSRVTLEIVREAPLIS